MVVLLQSSKMKIFLIILGVLAAVFVVAQVYISKNVSKTEEHQYEVLKDYGDFEVRRYEPALYSSVEINGSSYSEISGKGFRILAGYIFGDNAKNEKIAMTTPVTMDIDEQSKMMFMVPAKYSREELPDPNNDRIQFEEREEKVMAAITFGGWADDEKIAKYRSQLETMLREKGIAHTGEFLFLGYSPPFEVTNRRNEVVVELSDYEQDS